jgi:uncharacterized repeat protein (TIGR01451 family)
MNRNRLTFFTLAFIAPILLFAGFVMVVTTPTAHAAPLETVTNLDDSGSGSLRQAIADVDPGGTIEFGVSGTIVLASDLAINKELTIDGGQTITVSGNNSVRAFNIGSSGIVTLTGLTIRDGLAGQGGGIYSSGRLTVTHTTLISNTATQVGGAIRIIGAGATLYIADSDLQNNVAQSGNGGGAIYSDSGVTAVEVRNSILSNNVSQGAAGAAIILLVTNQFTMTGSVITNNTMIGGSIPSAVYSQGTVAEVTGNCFMGNSDSALRHQSGGSMDATGNWWGSASGPSGNGSGSGDSITGDNLVFTPFLTSPILGCGSIDADVVITKSVTPTIVTPDGAITYTLAFTNSGPSVATAVTIADSIPISVTITGVTSSTVGSGIAITQTSGSPNFAWAVSDLPVGAGGVITLTGVVSVSTPSALSGQIITNTAVIAASNDITATNNSASAAPYRLCGPGYWLETVTNSCQLALPGGYVPDFGYTEFFLCQPGTYQPNSGASSCLPAPVDNYVDSQGATAPTACPAGTNNPLQGSASVSACLLPLTVTTTADVVDANSGACAGMAAANLPGPDGLLSLREAICVANNVPGTGVITFDSSLDGNPVTLSIAGVNSENGNVNGDLDVTDDLIIEGNGAHLTTIDGNGRRIFDIPVSGVSLTLNRLTVTGSVASAAIFANATFTSLTLNEVVMWGNDNFSGSTSGGAIFFSSTNGSLTINNSTFRNNRAGSTGSGGAIRVGVGGGAVQINNSTFSGNWTANNGGALSIQNGAVTLTNVTIANNAAGVSGGGIHHAGGSVTLLNTIVANNGSNCAGTISSSGYNLDSGNTCGFAATGDLVDTDPLLGALVNNGGSTPTHALNNGSPAIDAGNCASGPVNDQRGVARPQDATCDIGAVEETGTLQCGVTAGNSYTFPNQSGVSIFVNSESDLECLYVDELPFNHPHATGLTDGANLRTGQYWQIRGLQADGITPATTFNVDLTLPYATASASTRACKWLDGVGPGFGWNCEDGVMGTELGSGTVTRQNVTAFSQWAVGDDVGPTAVTLSSFSVTPDLTGFVQSLIANLLGLIAAVLALMMGAGLWYRRRRQSV